MVRNRVLLLMVALTFVVSGCITTTNTTNGDGDEDVPPEPVLRTTNRTLQDDVDGPRVHAEETVVAGGWTLQGPATLEALGATLSWTVTQNSFQLRITGPNGTETVDGADGSAAYTPADPAGGTYTFDVIATGPVLEDTVTLELTYSWFETPGELPTGPVSFTKEGDRWRATIVYTAEQADAGDLELELDTFNGAINLRRDGTQSAEATLEAWAVADTKERAGELVNAIPVILRVSATEMVATATGQNVQRQDDESIGAKIDARVPAKVSGLVDTSNGGIELDDVETTGLDVDTSNGGITGKVTTSGDLLVDTSNGAIDLTIVPTMSLDLMIDTSNGAIDLALEESAEIGYRLPTDTSNGAISENMDEASLSGEADDTERTLETSGYDARTIKVTGTIDTSNGNIRFSSA